MRNMGIIKDIEVLKEIHTAQQEAIERNTNRLAIIDSDMDHIRKKLSSLKGTVNVLDSLRE